jgi:hypothetical protein
MIQAAQPAIPRSESSSRRLPPIARLTVALEVVIGVGAIFGGGLLVLGPDGHLLGMPTSMLAGTPFDSFLIPGVTLFTFVGLASLGAALMTLRRFALAPLAAVVVGVILVGWISSEMLILDGPQTLAWAVYLILGTVVATLGLVWARSLVSNSAGGIRP